MDLIKELRSYGMWRLLQLAVLQVAVVWAAFWLACQLFVGPAALSPHDLPSEVSVPAPLQEGGALSEWTKTLRERYLPFKASLFNYVRLDKERYTQVGEFISDVGSYYQLGGNINRLHKRYRLLKENGSLDVLPMVVNEDYSIKVIERQGGGFVDLPVDGILHRLDDRIEKQLRDMAQAQGLRLKPYEVIVYEKPTYVGLIMLVICLLLLDVSIFKVVVSLRALSGKRQEAEGKSDIALDRFSSLPLVSLKPMDTMFLSRWPDLAWSLCLGILLAAWGYFALSGWSLTVCLGIWLVSVFCAWMAARHSALCLVESAEGHYLLLAWGLHGFQVFELSKLLWVYRSEKRDGVSSQLVTGWDLGARRLVWSARDKDEAEKMHALLAEKADRACHEYSPALETLWQEASNVDAWLQGRES